jgi:low affinity Fe/Cu permease
MILKSEMKAKNKMTAIAALAVPVLRCRFGIVNWRLVEIRNIDRKTGKKLTMYKVHNPKTGIERLYVKKGKMDEEA